MNTNIGHPEKEPKIVGMFQQIVQVDDDVAELLRIDIKNIAPRSSGTFQIKTFTLGYYTGLYDEVGIGWRMPKNGGLYYDMYHHPIAGEITIEHKIMAANDKTPKNGLQTGDDPLYR